MSTAAAAAGVAAAGEYDVLRGKLRLIDYPYPYPYP